MVQGKDRPGVRSFQRTKETRARPQLSEVKDISIQSVHGLVAGKDPEGSEREGGVGLSLRGKFE